MSSADFLVILAGLFFGYWIVSRLLSGSGKQQEAPSRQADSEKSAPWTAPPAAPAWHEVLNVPPDADSETIKHAYRNLMSQYHPDKAASLGPELRALCEEKSKEINNAYDRAMLELLARGRARR